MNVATASLGATPGATCMPRVGTHAACARQAIRDELIGHSQYIAEHGGDMPEIRNWRRDAASASGGKV